MAAADHGGEAHEEKADNLNGSKFHQRAANRTHPWNRDIPEAGYITLGTIRYGVRFSGGPHAQSAATLGASQVVGATNERHASATNTESRSGSSDRSTSSSSNLTPSCCCIGSSGIVLPWSSNYARTKLPVPSSATAKNRTLSTSQSSFSLGAMSAPDPPPAVWSARELLQEQQGDGNASVTASQLQQQIEMATITPPMSTVAVRPQTESSSELAKIDPSAATTAPPLTSALASPTSTSTAPALSSSVLYQSCDSVRCGTASCCKLNPASVLVERCRELSVSSTSKTNPSVCCYTIANNSKAISKQSTRIGPKRIPRAALHHTFSPSRLGEPPPVPPKPTTESSEDRSIDPANFRRKIQKFEQQSAIESVEQQHNNRFEFFGCFSAGPNDRSECNSSLSETSSTNHASDSHAILKPKKFGTSVGSPTSRSASDEQNGIQSKCTLRYNSVGKPLSFSSSDQSLKRKCFSESQPAAVVIRKLTPKLSRKPFAFGDSHARGDSEDRLIGPSSDAECPVLTSGSGGADDDSDIGFIDSSGDGEHLSSLSDLDIHNLTYKTVTPITKNSCNLSFDSVPKIINNNNNHEHYSTRSLSARDIYDSLSDIESSTISCLSEDSFCCLCSGSSEQNLKSGEDLCVSIRAVCLCSERLRSFASESPKTTKDRDKCGNKESSQPWCDNSDIAYSPSPPLLHSALPPPTGGQLSLGSVRGPVLKRVPAIESFGYINNKGQLPVRGQQDKAIIMEKRRNTLDRLQRLGFGRRSSPSPTQESKSSSRKSSEKSERLKELTELLKGNRSSPTPPPVPPPRKLRQCNSFDKSSDSEQAPLSASGSDDIIPMDEEEEHIPVPVKRKSDEISHRKEGSVTAPVVNTQKSSLYHSLRPNTSVSNLESLFRRCDREKSKSPPVPLKEDEMFTKLPRAESKSIVGSYAQKTIPFRSASFSQIDYSSGKYIKSALGAIRDRLRRDKEPSVVDSANLTLPRKKDDRRSNSPRRHRRCGSADRDIQIIPLKKTELSINLKFEPENERVSLEELVNPPDVILEEEASTVESERLTESQEKLSDISANESPPTESSEAIVPTVIDQKSRNASPEPANMPIQEQCQAEVVTLTEEEIPLESPPENFLQTATTCLIPVPVYECTAQDWSPDSISERWVDVAPDEIGISPEIVDVIQEDTSGASKADDEGSSPEVSGDRILLDMDQVPTISVSHDSPQPTETTPNNEDGNKDEVVAQAVPTDKNDDSVRETNLERKESSETKSEAETRLEYTEVKKRYSNDDLKTGDRSQSVDSNLGRCGEEKRRLDKSRRRKGMYIQWPSIDKQDVGEWSSNIDTPGIADELKNKEVALDLMKVVDQCDESGPLFLTCRTPDDNRTPGLQSFDPSTPDSDYSRPIWPKINRRTSLTCQSSEEKDDSPLVGSPYPKSQRSLLFLRSDSISDNESDRTPPSREQTSPSPAPGDQDLKRYSKRPLRGPYGQMLEAEMKKPTKVNYDEILEELRDSDRTNSLSVRTQGAGNRSFDETNSAQHWKSSRVRKSNTSLPIPAHTRAASTPSQMENTTTAASIGGINPQDKRYQSSLDTSCLDSPVNSRLKEPKKFSLDSTRDRSPKRASSDTTSPDIKQHPKRSASNVSEKHQKRSLDEVRLSQTSRTPSERSMLSESGKGANILPTPELLAELLKGSSERLISEQRQQMFSDTRTHIVQEIFRNEQSYVDSLHTVVVKYLNVLKTPDYAGMIDSKTVDDIFFMVPEILSIHEKFLSEMKDRLDSWEPQQKVGDAFIETFSKTEVLETYTSFVNNCNRAKDAIRMTCQSRPSFARFLEAMSREHKGKLTLDNLLIKPVQKFPNYEMLFTRLIKHTDMDHPDQKHLQEVLKLVHDILVHINCKEKEVLENGQREATLRELEGVIEGATELVVPDRQFLIFDLVSMPSGQGARKERGFFLFSDLLVITSIKRRSGTIRKPNTTICPGSVASTLDTNKYKFLTKVSLDSLEIVKTKDENLRRIMNEIEQLADDCNKLQQIAEITATLKCPHQILEDTIRDLHREVQRQLSERQSNDAQLNLLELTVNSPSGTQKLSIVFSKPEKRSQWEEAFNEAKQKLAASLERHPIPEFLTSIPIRKTRAGLQFTCAAPTLSSQKDVWVCNSDGYVGQVCVLSLTPEPTVTSCNGVCNARILCVASVPAYSESKSQRTSSSNEETPRSSRNSNSSSHCHIAPPISSEKKKSSPKADRGTDIQLDSNSSSEESEIEGGANLERMPSPAPSLTRHHQQQDSNSDETDSHQSTMWLGTEDGCIHVYNCTDNIRIKKNKIKIQHVSAVYSILYLDNRVFVALANGDICVYLRDNAGWNTTSPLCISIGTVSSPVNKLLNVHGKLWCSIQGIIKVLDTQTLQVENQIQISSDSKPITNMAVSSNYVWISIQNSAHIKCFHSNSHDLILEVNLAPSVNKMLSNCDDIIRQHKAACLRVTSLLACRDLIWIGTSAGVLLTIPAQGYTKGQISNMPVVTGIPHGHTGHVRFLTCVDTGMCNSSISIDDGSSETKGNRNSIHSKTKSESGDILIISGGDGYEDFRSSGANTMSEIAGREDSTNHLLLWQM